MRNLLLLGITVLGLKLPAAREQRDQLSGCVSRVFAYYTTGIDDGTVSCTLLPPVHAWLDIYRFTAMPCPRAAVG